MKNNRLFLFVALLGTVLAGCQKVQETQIAEEKPTANKTWTLTIQATKDAATKAMELDGNTLNAYWKKGESVDVFLGGQWIGYLEVTSEDKVEPATLSGIIEAGTLTGGESLTLLFPAKGEAKWTYEGQDGSAPSADGKLATSFDYAMATLDNVTVDASTNTVSANTANFANQQSIFRFNFPAAMKSFTVSSQANKLVRNMNYEGSAWASSTGSISVTAANEASTFYVALRNETTAADNLYLTAVDNNGALYLGSKAVPAAAQGNGKFLNATVALTQQTMAPAPASGTISTVSDVL